MLVIGMMSGTSYDAMDAAAAELWIDGDTLVLEPRGMVSEPYPAWLLAAVETALPPAAVTLADICRLDTWIGQAFARLAARANAELCGGAAELVTSHGQTLHHWVHDGEVHGTLQVGQPAWIAEATGVAVVSDLRSRDVAAGGQGAPLVSIFDVLWLAGRPGTPVALNLGGIANITVTSADPPVAFDTGPANALIDAAVRHLTDGRQAFDVDGVMAARGAVHDGLLHRLLAEPYYALPAPKSTGKELFHLPYLLAALDALDGAPPGPDDVVATLTELTARTVADAVHRHGGDEVLAAGGGTRNPTLMHRLSVALDGVPVRTSGELGIPAAAKEAYAFALLGFLSVHGLPGTVASCTGARRATVLGCLTPGRDSLRLPEIPDPAPTKLRVQTAEDTDVSDLARLTTETRNPASAGLDAMGVEQMLLVMNDEDARVAAAVRTAIPQVAAAVELAVAGLRSGGRLIYAGAGTSGRLGLLDAVECPPTFGTAPEQVVGLVAGGDSAVGVAVEGAEDSAELGAADIRGLAVSAADTVVGLTASGRTPYVIGALEAARAAGASTVSIACNSDAEVSAHADVAIEVDSGPEVLAGSTRLKSGTSQKLLLNMLSTASMVQLGKVFGNLMVDVRPTNHKLVERAQRVIADATGCDAGTAADAYRRAQGHPKTAIVMLLAEVGPEEARQRLAAADGFVGPAVRRDPRHTYHEGQR